MSALYQNVTVDPERHINAIKVPKGKQLSSQRKIIREVFSPPIKKKKRRNNASRDHGATFSIRNMSPETRNYTPNVDPAKSFGENEDSYPMHRIFTSDGISGRNFKSNQNSFSKVPGNARFAYFTNDHPLAHNY